jgi:hypothetical protein
MPPKSRLVHFEPGMGLTDLCIMGILRKLTFVLGLILVADMLAGQTTLLPASSVWQYASGVAGWKDDAFGSLRHPAMPGSSSRLSMGILGESMYGIPGAAMLSAVMGGRLGTGVVGGVMDHRSFSGSGETRLVFGYALPLSSALRAGLRLGFQSWRMPGHRMISGIPIEWGLLYRQQRLAVGVTASHPVSTSRIKESSGIPVVFRVSTGYELSPTTGLALDVVREQGWGLSCRPMIFYQPIPTLRLNGGVMADRGSMFLGIRYKRGMWAMNLFFDRHPLMGWTGAFGFDHGLNREAE